MQLYDNFGREIEIQKRPDDRILAVASVRDRYSSYPSNGLTPSKLASIFKQADSGDVYSQMELFEEMEEKDTHLYSILQTRKLAIAGLDFEVMPFSEEKRDKDIADFISQNIFGLVDFEDNLLDLCDAIGKGYSALEIYWDVKDGKNIARHLANIHPKKFTWANGAAPKLVTDENFNSIDLPAFKFIFHQHKARTGHPTRQGILRVCAWLYLFKNYSIKDWVAFAEVFGMPLRLGKYDTSASKEDKDALITAVRSLGTDAAGIISKSTEIQFIEAVKNSGKDVYEVLASFCNSEMSKAVLGQTLTTQQGESGSYSLGQVHDSVRRDLLQADCEAIAKTIKRDLIRPLVGFNFGWDVNLPWFKFHYEEPADLKAEAEKIEILTRAGAGKTIPAKWVNEKFNIPMPEDGEETLGMQISNDKVQMTNKRHEYYMCGCMANKEDAAVNKDNIDNITDKLLQEADLNPLIDPLKKLVDEAESMEDLRDKILDVYKDMDAVDLGSLMQQAFMAADLLGRFEAKQG